MADCCKFPQKIDERIIDIVANDISLLEYGSYHKRAYERMWNNVLSVALTSRAWLSYAQRHLTEKLLITSPPQLSRITPMLQWRESQGRNRARPKSLGILGDVAILDTCHDGTLDWYSSVPVRLAYYSRNLEILHLKDLDLNNTHPSFVRLVSCPRSITTLVLINVVFWACSQMGRFIQSFPNLTHLTLFSVRTREQEDPSTPGTLTRFLQPSRIRRVRLESLTLGGIENPMLRMLILLLVDDGMVSSVHTLSLEQGLGWKPPDGLDVVRNQQDFTLQKLIEACGSSLRHLDMGNTEEASINFKANTSLETLRLCSKSFMDRRVPIISALLQNSIPTIISPHFRIISLELRFTRQKYLLSIPWQELDTTLCSDQAKFPKLTRVNVCLKFLGGKRGGIGAKVDRDEVEKELKGFMPSLSERDLLRVDMRVS